MEASKQEKTDLEIFDQLVEGKTQDLEPLPPQKQSILQLLQKRYPSNEYALLREVRDKAGFYASRSADYVAINLWPSRGLAVNGIEVKSFRSDWLNERKNPEKAENIFKYCDYFWLLTENDDVAKLDEIPETWGWLSIKGQKILVKKDAPKLSPIPLTRHIVCAMLKRAIDKTDYVHKDTIEDRIKEARESGTNSRSYELEKSRDNFQRLQKILDDFKKSSGIDLERNTWQKDYTKRIGEAVKFVESGGLSSIKEELFGLEKKAKRVLDDISKALNL